MSKNSLASRKRLAALTQGLAGNSSTVVTSFGQMHRSVGGDGALSEKQKELMVLGIAIASRCEGCIQCYTQDALNSGASRQEIEEAIGVAVLMGGTASVPYGCEALDALSESEEGSSNAA